MLLLLCTPTDPTAPHGADVGTAVESLVIGDASQVAGDVASGAQGATVTAVVPATDVAGAVELGTVGPLGATDSASAVDSASAAVPKVGADTATGVDTQARTGFGDVSGGHRYPHGIVGTLCMVDNSFDGGPDGVDIAEINSGEASGTPFDVAYRFGGVFRFDASQSWRGGRSALIGTSAFDPETGYGAEAWGEWREETLGRHNELWTRFYMRFSPDMDDNKIVVEWGDTETDSYNQFWLLGSANPAGVTAMIYAGAESVGLWGTTGQFSIPLAPDTWYRVEVFQRFSLGPGDGIAGARTDLYIFEGDDNHGNSHVAGSNQFHPTSLVEYCNRIAVGSQVGTIDDTADVWIDNFAVSSVDWVGIAATLPIFAVDFATSAEEVPDLFTNTTVSTSGSDTASATDSAIPAVEVATVDDVATSDDYAVPMADGINDVLAFELVLASDSGVYEDA